MSLYSTCNILTFFSITLPPTPFTPFNPPLLLSPVLFRIVIALLQLFIDRKPLLDYEDLMQEES